MVVLEPVPVIAPGVIVQLPDGRLFRITLPVITAHVGCVMAPMVGAEGAPGAAFNTTVDDGREVHPDAKLTVKL